MPSPRTKIEPLNEVVYSATDSDGIFLVQVTRKSETVALLTVEYYRTHEQILEEPVACHGAASITPSDIQLWETKAWEVIQRYKSNTLTDWNRDPE